MLLESSRGVLPPPTRSHQRRTKYSNPAASEPTRERDACGVGLVVSKTNKPSNEVLRLGLTGLRNMEKRGGVGADGKSADGAGVRTAIPRKLIGCGEKDAVAMLFLPKEADKQDLLLQRLKENLTEAGLGECKLITRKVPVQSRVLGDSASKTVPEVMQVTIPRIPSNLSDAAFEKLLYLAQVHLEQFARSREGYESFSVASMSAKTITYKALTTSADLANYFTDLNDSLYETNFIEFHRRFSTNTSPSWGRAQPTDAVAHNGEINAVSANRLQMHAIEAGNKHNPGLFVHHSGKTDSGSFGQAVNMFLRRGGRFKNLSQIMSQMMPAAGVDTSDSGIAPWDGPALVIANDGEMISARLDRNGLRPARVQETDEYILLSSEAGCFEIHDSKITRKSRLKPGAGIDLNITVGQNCADLEDFGVGTPLAAIKRDKIPCTAQSRWGLNLEKPQAVELMKRYGFTREDVDRMESLVRQGKGLVGSMGATSRPAWLSPEPRSFFEYFYHGFAQVTNPPIDYLREKFVTCLKTTLGEQVNPLVRDQKLSSAIELEQPILSLGQLEGIIEKTTDNNSGIHSAKIFALFDPTKGKDSLQDRLRKIAENAVAEAVAGKTVIIISDDLETSPSDNNSILQIPTLLVTGVVVKALEEAGLLTKASVVVDSGDAKTEHDVAMLIAAGAQAVCPRVALEVARSDYFKTEKDFTEPQEREATMIKGYVNGLLKIMSKMGISVVQSYRFSRLFTVMGLGNDVAGLFGDKRSPVAGLSLETLQARLVENKDKCVKAKGLYNAGILRENGAEPHLASVSDARKLHQILGKKQSGDEVEYEESAFAELVSEYHKRVGDKQDQDPVKLIHLLQLKANPYGQRNKAFVQGELFSSRGLFQRLKTSLKSTLKLLGSGHMSFGAINWAAQRDILRGAADVGARGGSGEGGENRAYFDEGDSASVKQVASGSFGVTADYLNTTDITEIQIKVAQGAKPGEGGQIPGLKVTAEIARARNAQPGQELISPPPLHDVYSIEDLYFKIAQLKEVNPHVKISVKLVAGVDVGTIAVGVAKAGADVIHIAGNDGGTGASPVDSMQSAGLPVELGLIDAHHSLLNEGLRERVKIRVDGGLTSADDVIKLGMLGADEFDFGRLMMEAIGCIMQRACHSSKCGPAIAVNGEDKVKEYLKKNPNAHKDVAKMFLLIAKGIDDKIKELGFNSFDEIKGRPDLLAVKDNHKEHLSKLGLNIEPLLTPCEVPYKPKENSKVPSYTSGGQEIIDKVQRNLSAIWDSGHEQTVHVTVKNGDTALGAALSGKFARISNMRHQVGLATDDSELKFAPYTAHAPKGKVRIIAKGSAGQGAGVFCRDGIEIIIEGEAQDSVAKHMSGGLVVVKPPSERQYVAEESVIIGNVAGYGATGGKLFVHGQAGDRFAVRNSGMQAVVEGAGTSACEYMTNGRVVILGEIEQNAGAGMSGGEFYILDNQINNVNQDSVIEEELTELDKQNLIKLLNEYYNETGSVTAQYQLSLLTSGQPTNLKKFVSRAKPAANGTLKAAA